MKRLKRLVKSHLYNDAGGKKIPLLTKLKISLGAGFGYSLVSVTTGWRFQNGYGWNLTEFFAMGLLWSAFIWMILWAMEGLSGR